MHVPKVEYPFIAQMTHKCDAQDVCWHLGSRPWRCATLVTLQPGRFGAGYVRVKPENFLTLAT